MGHSQGSHPRGCPSRLNWPTDAISTSICNIWPLHVYTVHIIQYLRSPDWYKFLTILYVDENSTKRIKPKAIPKMIGRTFPLQVSTNCHNIFMDDSSVSIQVHTTLPLCPAGAGPKFLCSICKKQSHQTVTLKLIVVAIIVYTTPMII